MVIASVVVLRSGFVKMLVACFVLVLFPNLLLLHNGPVLAQGQESSPLWDKTWKDKLKKRLFTGYDKAGRPSEHFNQTTVYFSVTTYHVALDEQESSFTVIGYTHKRWNDDKLKWNPADYGGLKLINVDSDEIWKPDISLYNNADGTLDHFENSNAIIYNDGTVLWVPPSKYRAFCEIDYRFWPFDTQNCTLLIGSWTYDGNRLDLQFKSNDSHDTTYMKNQSQWKLKKIVTRRESKMYDCCPEPYVLLHISFLVERKSTLYRSFILTPAVAVVGLILATFWLPSQSEMRIVLGGCNAILVSIYLIYFSFQIPPTDNPPLLIHFFGGCMWLVMLSLVISVVVMRMSRRPHYQPLPHAIQLLLRNWPEKILGLGDLVHQVASRKPSTAQELHGKTEESTTNEWDDCDRQNIICSPQDLVKLEWIVAASVLDRISFVFLSIIFCIMGVRYVM